jgi:hypothetical protein
MRNTNTVEKLCEKRSSSITKLTAEFIQKSKNNRESTKTQQATASKNNSSQKDDDVFNKLYCDNKMMKKLMLYIFSLQRLNNQ